MAEKYFSPSHIYSISWPLTTGNDPIMSFLGQTKPPTYFRLTMHQWGLVLSANCRYGADEQMTDHIPASCPQYHPPNGDPVLEALYDDTVNWLKKITLSI